MVNELISTSIAKEDVITILHPSDVLMGRGSPTINYEGNVAFRAIVKDRKAEYTASGQHKTKDRVSREIFHLIIDKGGRFLRRVDPAELKQMSMASDAKAWVQVREEVALEKVKQALRDKDQSRYRSRAREAMNAHHEASRLLEGGGQQSISQALLLEHLIQQQNSQDLLVLAQLQRHELQRKHIIEGLVDHQGANNYLGFPSLTAAPMPVSPTSMFLFR